MADQHAVRRLVERFLNHAAKRHRAELGIDQPDLVSRIDERPANREQPQRRQMVVGYAAADRRVP